MRRVPPWPHRSLAERFWALVDRSAGPVACWPFLGAVDADGYGKFKLAKGRVEQAHRVALALSGVALEVGLYVLHSCPVSCPGCCNPAHLRQGTQSENVAELWARGRRKIPNALKIQEG